ncbi:MAG: hypothetical protein J5588_05985 [Bacteroidales bacterium]|nr:hypothetical protein [Bacteroidales bacterium]
MKEKILQALKTKFSSFGFGEKALDGVATYLTTSVKDEKDIETAIAGVEGLLKVFQSEQDSLRGGKSEAEKKLEELKKQIEALGGGKKDDEPKPAVDKDAPEWAKAMLEQISKQNERLNRMETEKLSNARKSEIGKIIEKLPESLKKSYQRISFDSLNDEDYDKLKGEITTEVDAIAKEMSQKGAVFGAPQGGGNDEGHKSEVSKEEVEDVVNKLNIN